MAKNPGNGKYKSHVKPRLDEVAQWVSDGVTYKQIAQNLGVADSSWYEYIAKHSELSDAIARGRKRDADTLAGILHQRASGFTGPDGRYYPPDVKALLAMLGNRAPSEWGGKTQIDATVTLSEDDRKLLEQVRTRANTADK